MYHGTQWQAQQQYTTKWYPGIGDVTVRAGIVQVERHLYACDHCKKAYAFPEQAREPFYCSSATCRAAKLVSIERSADACAS